MRRKSVEFTIANVVLILLLCLAAKGQHQISQEKPDEIKTLALGQVFDREIAQMQKHRYSIELEAGQFVKFDVEENEVDVVMSLRSPDGANLLGYADVKPVNGVKSVSAAVSVKGTYELRVISYGESKGKGSYRLKIHEIRPAAEDELNCTAGLKLYNETFSAPFNTALLTSDLMRAKIEKGRQALEKFHQAKAVKNESLTLWQMGVVSSLLGMNTQAIEFYEQSFEKSRTINDRTGQANTLRDLGRIYSKVGEWDHAFQSFAESLKIAREDKLDTTEAGVLNLFGQAYAKFGDNERAAIYFRQSSEIFLEHSNMSRSIPLNNLGRISFAAGEMEKAEGYFRQAIDTVRDEKFRFGTTKFQESGYLNNLGRAQYALGKREKAMETFNESLKSSNETGDKADSAPALKLIGRIYLDSGNADKAFEFFSKSLEIFRGVEDTQNVTELLLLVSKAEAAKNNLESAQNHVEEAINLIEKERSSVQTADLRDSFSANLRDFYSFYVELLMQRHTQEPGKNFAEAALQANERGRARGLLNLLAESKANIREGVDAGLLQKEKELKSLLSERLENLTKVLNGKAKPEDINKLKVEIEQIRAENEQTQAQIRRTSPHYSDLTQPKILGLKEIQTQVLDDRSVLLEYALGQTKSHLWVVTKDTFQTVELPARNEIEKASRGFYDALTARNKEIKFETTEERDARISKADAKLQDYSGALSRMVLAPAAPYLSNKRLLIVADGALQYVPFAALAAPASGNSKAATTLRNVETGTQFLIESNEIVSLPSASALAILRKETENRKPSPKTLAILADPIFDKKDERFQDVGNKTKTKTDPSFIAVAKRQTRGGGDFLTRDNLNLVRLPFTRREANLISAMVPAKQQEKLLDFAASRRSAMSAELSNFRFVHFATHGFIDNDNPELSGIVLSMFDENGKDQDGFLRVGDIYNLKLPAEMVVLSGCKTGLGKDIRGEGLVGLTRGFMYAGAKRVTVSLWDVNDEATADLMGRYYREMLGEKKRQPAAALRQAQVSMIKDKRWQNPYFWATFLLHGEPR